MTNDTKTNLKPRHGSNYSYKHSNLSLNDTNLSLITNNSSSAIQTVSFTEKRKYLKSVFSDVTPVITHFLVNLIRMIALIKRPFKLVCRNSSNIKFGINRFTTDDNKRYYSHTTKHSAAKPSRQPLAIFVSKTELVNTQQVTAGMNKLVLRFKRYTYDVGHNIVSYDGMSELNKIPLWGNKFRRLNAVVVIPFIPFFKNTTTHTKHSGGYHA